MSVTGTTDRKQILLARLSDARQRTDELFTIVRSEAMFDRPIPERHRIVFYLGHLEAFDWNLICRGHSQIEPFNDAFDRLFAFGIDPVDGGLPSDRPSDWPDVAAVRAYNARVRETVDRQLESETVDAESPLAVRFEVAIEHRLMHAETLAYMFHQMPYERKHARSDPAPPSGRTSPRRISIPAGAAVLGRARGHGFGWDNEFDLNTREVPAFAIDSHSVTHREFEEFVDAGGYERRELWSDAAWAWQEQHGLHHPAFWRKTPGGWRYRGMFEERPLPPEWPAYVSHAEATAFARWRRLALPTEAEFHRAAYGTPSGPEREYPWGDSAPDGLRGNFDFQRWDPTPAGSFPAGHSAFGVTDLVGNGWEWTDTLFEPFPGFQAFPFYPGYSANFFDGHHYVMKGGSSRTAACMLRRSFRNWFQPHYPYVYAKFRCVER